MADCCVGKGVHQLRKIMIFGNSGSGKSTLAKKLVKAEGLSYLDLDSLAAARSALTKSTFGGIKKEN